MVKGKSLLLCDAVANNNILFFTFKSKRGNGGILVVHCYIFPEPH